MMFVVDSNVLFTYFWKDSAFEGISSKKNIKLFSPKYAMKEIMKYSSEIMRKSGLSRKEFEQRRKKLTEIIEFVQLKEYSLLLKQAKLLARNLSKEEYTEFLKDIDFFALAQRFNCAIWTNDRLLKKQPDIPVFNTKEMIILLG